MQTSGSELYASQPLLSAFAHINAAAEDIDAPWLSSVFDGLICGLTEYGRFKLLFFNFSQVWSS